ncbi:hypothetical protein NC981_11225 [Leptolyngbya sp. DQ-M1]|uniref:hypothetical protein n=1 Tax=Leptolyngbya sp. DQ-M1 TaxID=2933920 RepID=UPI0032994D5F
MKQRFARDQRSLIPGVKQLLRPQFIQPFRLEADKGKSIALLFLQSAATTQHQRIFFNPLG